MPELHVIAAGSLLEFAFGEIYIPVGRVQYMRIYPMSFYEYLNAIRGESLAAESLKHPGTVNERVQNLLLEELLRYFLIGGSSAEVDYLLTFNGKIYPIEAKSGAAGSLKSLHMLPQKYPNCPRGLDFYNGTYKNLPEQKLEYLPLYNAGGMSGERISDI